MPDILSQDEISALIKVHKILVAEPDTEKRKSISETLQAIGQVEIREAETGSSALELLEKNTFDLVITAWEIPELNGKDFLNEIRNRARFAALPVLMLIASGRTGPIQDALQFGADDILLEPYTNEILIQKTKVLFNGRRSGKITLKALNSISEKTSQKYIDTILKRSRPAQRPIITYDFKHPQRVSKDQQRTLENLHSNLSRMMASSFSTIQSSVVDCDIAFVDQTTYAEFIMSLSNPSCSYTFTIAPLGGPAIIDFSLPVAYSFIDRQFGGTGGNPPQEARPLTSIERRVMGKVVTRTLADLESTWEALLKIQVSDAELETNPEFMQVAAPSDTVVLIAFEINSQHASGLVNLCYPYFTLEPVMAYLNVQTWASRERGRRESGRKERLIQLDLIDVPVSAQLAKGEISLKDLADIKVGDVIKMDTKTTDPTVIWIGDRPKLLARPTRKDNQMAVQVTEGIPKAHEVKYMNVVQKTETYEL